MNPVTMVVNCSVIDEIEKDQIDVWENGPEDGGGKGPALYARDFPEAISRRKMCCKHVDVAAPAGLCPFAEVRWQV